MADNQSCLVRHFNLQEGAILILSVMPTFLIKSRSCETSSVPPRYCLRAASSASIVAMSRLLVGSSRISRPASFAVIPASSTFARSPPLSSDPGVVCNVSFLILNLISRFIASCSSSEGAK